MENFWGEWTKGEKDDQQAIKELFEGKEVKKGENIK